MVCYLKPFKMDGHCTVRDLLFLWLAVEVVSFMISYGGYVTKLDSICKFFMEFTKQILYIL